ASATTFTGATLLGLVHAQRTAVDHGPIERGDGLLCFLARAHGQEREAPGPPGLPVGDDLGIDHRAMRLKRSAKVLLRGLEGEVAHEQSLVHLSFRSWIGPRPHLGAVLLWLGARGP